jgi:hypothetical protein
MTLTNLLCLVVHDTDEPAVSGGRTGAALSVPAPAAATGKFVTCAAAADALSSPSFQSHTSVVLVPARM